VRTRRRARPTSTGRREGRVRPVVQAGIARHRPFVVLVVFQVLALV
jgi:hypothetical protein